MLLFKIFRISYGWFDVCIRGQFYLTNSDYLFCDAPMLLLEALSDLLENKVEESWLCWQEEPEAHILNLERQDDRLIIRVYEADKDSYDLDHSGMDLSKHIKQCVFQTEEDIIKAAKNIVEEFSLYENGNGRNIYDAHWGDRYEQWGKFPERQYNRLKKLLR
jgi:hypothetical protein